MLTDHSLDRQTSGTAMATAFLRALAARDERAGIRGQDHLAELFLDEEHLRPVHDAKARAWVLQKVVAPGAYEFMIARTAFFDSLVQDALKRDIPQLVFLGAGYDTRPYRFAGLIRATHIFELDTAPTQACKQDRLRAAGISISDRIHFVPINFESDDLQATLLRAGYEPDQPTFFIWEGVSYYLSAEAVDGVLAFVRRHAGPGSSIAFDYAAISPRSLQDDGSRQLREHMRSKYSGEPVGFGIPAGEIDSFLAARGFETLQHITAAGMREKYLAGDRYPELSTPAALFCFVHAKRLGPSDGSAA